MRVLCKRTNEIDDAEILQIYDLFYLIFGKKRDIETFRSEYSNTPLGYSFHSLLYDDSDAIVGFHSCMPFYYIDGNRRFLAALGIDSMVKQEYRDYFNFRDMITVCQERLRKEGCILRIGFPNDNSYPILKKGLKHRDIGKLTTYCMIRNLGAVSSKLSFLNIFSRSFSLMQYLFSYFSICNKIYTFQYHKERETFDTVRYNWFGGDYRKIDEESFRFVYKIEMYNNVRTAFLLDVFPLSKKNFEAAVRYIYRKEISSIDMILYVGKLPFVPISLLTVLHKFEPKHFNFTCKPLVEGYFDNSIYDIRNWDVNLSNYDLL